MSSQRVGTAGRSRRRLVAGIAAVACATMLTAACGDGSGDGGGGDGKVKLVWWHNQNADPGLTFYKDMAAEYMKAHPNVEIEQVPLQSEDLKAKLQVAMQSPNPPDIIHQWGGGWMKDQVAAGKLMDMTDATADLTPKLAGISGWQLDGRTYGLPYTVGVVGFWYRKDAFAKAKLTPPTTLEALLQDAPKLRDVGAPIVVGAKDKWPTAFWYDYLAVRECSQQTLDSTVQSLDFSDPCWGKAEADFQKIVEAKPFAKGYLGTAAQQGATSSAGKLANGTGGMELMGQWQPSVMTDLTKDKKAPSPDVLGWFPFPSVAGATGSQNASLGGGDGYSCSVTAPKECVDFLKWFTSVDVQKRYAQTTGQLPANKDASSAISDPNLKDVAQARDSSEYVQLYLDVAFGQDVGNALNDAVALQLAGTSKAGAMAKALDAAAAATK